MIVLRVAAAMACPLLVAGCLTAKERVDHRREITIRVVPADARATLGATIQVLQDRGFVIDETDETTGLVHATRQTTVSLSALGRLVRAAFDGDARRSMEDGQSYEVTLVLTPQGRSSTHVRALVVRKSAAGVEEGAKTIYERGLYRRLFDDIVAATERRRSAHDSDDEPEEAYR